MMGLDFLGDSLAFDWAIVLDIVLVTAVIYATLMLIRGTRAVQVLRGFIVLSLLFFIVNSLIELSNVIQLPAMAWLLDRIIPAVIVAIPVIFQPELRRALEQLGHLSNYVRFFRSKQKSPMVTAVKEAALYLSQRRHGALIIFERDTGLQEYVDTGIVLDAEPSPELFTTIFNKYTELHDGAVIVRGEKVAAASCVMPLSSSSLTDRQMGLRHRAALGISEVSDAVAMVISEETGQISIAHNGRIMRRQDISHIELTLNAFLQNRQLRES